MFETEVENMVRVKLGNHNSNSNKFSFKINMNGERIIPLQWVKMYYRPHGDR
jgi:hypothetical protein